MSWQTPLNLRSYPNAIIHIDGDAFFASIEQAIRPELQGKPLITGKERGIAASLSYEAKALGVKRGMTIFEIKKICPQAIILPNDYETYSLYSKRMFAIMRRYTSMVEEYSIDEGFCDITGLRRPLRMKYPAIAEAMKQAIDKELGFTVSLGLAPSKTLAKAASKYKKPNGLTCIPGREIDKYLRAIKAEDLWGVGPATCAYMKKLGIITALDFIKKDYDWVCKKFTKPHQEMWRELRGEMVYPVTTASKTGYQTISKTKTFTPASNNKEFVFSQLIKNVENGCIKLRRHNLVARKIIVFVKTQEFRFQGIEAVLNRPSSYPAEMSKLIEMLFEQIFKPQEQYRATGAAFCDIIEDSSIQRSLFENALQIEKMQSIYKAVDKLSSRWGKHTVHLASSLQANKFSRHLGERGDLPSRRASLLKGETGRQRLSIPMLQLISKK